MEQPQWNLSEGPFSDWTANERRLVKALAQLNGLKHVKGVIPPWPNCESLSPFHFVLDLLFGL